MEDCHLMERHVGSAEEFDDINKDEMLRQKGMSEDEWDVQCFKRFRLDNTMIQQDDSSDMDDGEYPCMLRMLFCKNDAVVFDSDMEDGDDSESYYDSDSS